MGQGGSLYGFVGRNGQFERFRAGAFLQADVAAFLPDYDPAISLKSFDNLGVGEAGNLGHTAISSCSESAAEAASSSTGSR